MRRWKSLVLLIALLLAGPAAADDLSGPGRRTLLAGPAGIVFCEGDLPIQSHGDSGRITVLTPSGPIQVVPQAENLIIQYPDQSLRMRRTVADRETELLVQFGGKNYRFFDRKREWEWRFPEEQAFFTVSSGSLRQVIGDKGMLKVSSRPSTGLYHVVSEAGESDYRLAGKPASIETVEGEGPDKHVYLTRGVIFQEGPVGLFVPLRGGALVAALDWSCVRRFEAPLPGPKERLPEAAPQPDPLVAPPSEWRSQALEADTTPVGEDPMNLNLKPVPPAKRDDPLKATTAPNSEELLRVKDFEP